MPQQSHLVLAAVNWPRWDLSAKNIEELQKFLLALLTVEGQGRGWLLHDDSRAKEWLRTRMSEGEVDTTSDHHHIYGPYQWLKTQQRDDAAWVPDAAAPSRVRLVIDGLTQCLELTQRTRGVAAQHEILTPQLNLFACRLFLDEARVCHILGQEGPLRADGGPCYATVDVRFQYSLGAYRCYLSLGLWTRWPGSRQLAPPSEEPEPTPCQHDEAVALHGLFTRTLRAKFRELCARYFPPYEFHVFDPPYFPPTFFVVLSETPDGADPAAHYLDGDGESVTQRYAKRFLGVGDRRDDNVAIAVLDERLVVLRRFVARHDRDRPCYLLLASNAASEHDEDTIRDTIEMLASMEGRTAADLFDIETDLEIYENHISVYEAVAVEGWALWDELAMHLPTATLGPLDKSHRAIQVVHQVLLQGVADLDDIAARTQGRGARLERESDRLGEYYDSHLSGRRWNDSPSVRDSFSKLGHFERVRRIARDTDARANEVQERYRALLEAIGRAFDERRAREADVLEMASVRLALIAGVLAAASLLEIVLGVAIEGLFPWLVYLLRVAVLVIIAWVLYFTLSYVFRQQREGSLASSKEFEEQYREVRTYLVEASTQALTSYSNQENVDWKQKDAHLATRFAELWDDTAAATGQPVGSDLERLQQRAEQWLLRAMLATERPRRFVDFQLPRLTCLYRFLPHNLPGAEPTLSLATRFELATTLHDGCGFSRKELREIDEWGVLRTRQSDRVATSILEELGDGGIGLHVEMDPPARTRALATIRLAQQTPRS